MTQISSVGGSSVTQVLNIQAASSLAGQVAVTVTANTRGGDRLRKFLLDANNAQLVARLFAEAARRRMLPDLISKMPRRSGRLAGRLEIRQTGLEVGIYSIFYGRFVVFNQGRDSVKEVIADSFARHQREIVREVLQRLIP